MVIVGSESESRITTQFESLLKQLSPSAQVSNLAGKTSLKQLAAGLLMSDVLLTIDSGPMHLAAGLGTPVMGVFTCTSPVRSGPPGEHHELATTTLSCRASYKKRCPYSGKKHLACMEHIKTEQVWQSLLQLMSRVASRDEAQRVG